MNITPIDGNNVSMQGKTGKPDWITRQLKRVEQKILNGLPSHTTKEGENSVKNWDKTSGWVGHPMWNRGIMGATALLTQPTIDYYNHRVDDETRTVSRNRTIAKIVAGTLVGMFVVRGPIHKIVTKMTNVHGNGKWDKKLLPKIYLKKLKENARALENYRSSLAMALILATNLVTNFVLDAPLTILLTNYFNKQSGVKLPDEKENNTDTSLKTEEPQTAREVKDA